MNIGIESIGFYTSRYVLDLKNLAQMRQIEIEKFCAAGQSQMSIAPPNEDIVTMSASAALEALKESNKNEIDQLFFATESSFDQSKCAGIYVHHLLGLKNNCRVIEFKQACYGATGALQLAVNEIRQNPHQKILVIAADIAHYALNSVAETSLGCGAIALIISAHPSILTIEKVSGYYVEDVMDFWRPNYLTVPLVDGKYSARIYLEALEKSFKAFHEKTNLNLNQIDYFCYHTPVPKLVEKAHKKLLQSLPEFYEKTVKDIQTGLCYAREVGNIYTASLYLNLLSLLENTEQDLSGKRVGFYSYGSGCMAEFFTGIVQKDYQKKLNKNFHEQQLSKRKFINVETYEDWHRFSLPEDGSLFELQQNETGEFSLKNVDQHKRNYVRQRAVCE